MSLSTAEQPPESAAARFVRLCLSARWQAGALEAARALAAQDGFDWRAVVSVAGRGDVAPLLYDATRDSGLVPAALAERLHEAYYLTTTRNVRLFRALELVLRQLEAEGVPVIVLKGAALVQQVYHNPALRPMADLDLLVRREDVSRTRRVLSTLGYEAANPAMGDEAGTYSHAVMLVDPATPEAALDVHWSLFGSLYYYYRVPLDWFWQTSEPTRFGEAPARLFGPAAQVLYLCAHILQHTQQDVAKLIAFHDVAAGLASCGDRLDWDELLGQAQAFGLVLAVQHVLSRLQDEWHVPLPDPVLARLSALQPASGEQRAFDRLTAASPAQSFWSELRRIPGWRPRLSFARAILLPTTEYMRWRYQITRRWLLPLYYPYRWLGSLRRSRQQRSTGLY